MFQVESSDTIVRVSTVKDDRTIRSALSAAQSTGEGGRIFAKALKEKLGRVLGIPLGNIDIKHSLVSYGVDSLVGLELKNWLVKEAKADLAVFEILSGSALTEIGQTAATRSMLISTDSSS